MKDYYDFSKGKRGRVRTPQPEPAGKVKITIRLDADVVDHYLTEADKLGGRVGYQTLINDALRRAIETPALEDMMRRVVREEIVAARSVA